MCDTPALLLQDAFALASQNKAEAAQSAGMFKEEIVPVKVAGRKGDIIVAEGMQLFAIWRNFALPSCARGRTLRLTCAVGRACSELAEQLLYMPRLSLWWLSAFARRLFTRSIGISFPFILAQGATP